MKLSEVIDIFKNIDGCTTEFFSDIPIWFIFKRELSGHETYAILLPYPKHTTDDTGFNLFLRHGLRKNNAHPYFNPYSKEETLEFILDNYKEHFVELYNCFFSDIIENDLI